MIQTFTWLEVGVAAAILLLAGNELIGLVLARRQGLTRNVSRLVTYSSLMVLGLVYGALSLRGSAAMTAADPLAGMRQAPTANWPYLVAAVMIAVVASYEVASHVGALRSGLTTNVSRLVSLAGVLVLLVVLLGISAAKWDLYLERLESTYLEAIR